MIRYQRFRREFMNWRINQLDSVRDLSTITELPYGSILHVFDNFPMDGRLEWGPRKDNYFLAMNKFRIFMHNVTDFPEPKSSDVAKPSRDKLILTKSGVLGNLATYKREMSPRVMFVPGIDSIPIRPSTMGVVNYNPLFRARVIGMYKKIRFFNFFLSVLINKIMEAPEKQHFIHVPLENYMYEKKDFVRIFRKFDRIGTLYKERSSYLFLAHFYGILAMPMSLPARGSFEEPEDDLTVEAGTESLTPDLIGQETESYTASDFLANLREYALESPSIAMEALKEGENPYQKSIFEFVPGKYFENINFIFTVGNKYVCYNLRDLKDMNGRGIVALLRCIKNINQLVSTSPSGVFVEEVDDTPKAPEKVTEIDEVQLETGNIIPFSSPLTLKEKTDAAEIDLLELDNVNKILEGMPDTKTKAQKERVVKISKAYKDLKIGSTTFSEVLSNLDDDSLKPPEVKTDSSEKGTLKKEATSSTTAVLNRTYIDKKMEHDIAAIAVSFNKLGMFLTDFTEEKQTDELNAFVKYTATYEDTEHKTHRIRFSLPKVDKMGRTKINGVMKAMTIQRVSLPICKVSATRVTLNSNYNKALIERNQNVAHSFIDWFTRKFMSKLTEKGFKCVQGICKFPLKAIPFELTELGHHYHEITYAGGKLTFMHEKRFDTVPPKYKNVVPKMEKENGVFFGYKNDTAFFMYVDGLVVAKNLTSGDEEFCGGFTHFLSYLSGLPAIGPVEYIDIEYLNKKIPLIHMLAYRYGLTNMLQYMQVDYHIYDRNERVDVLPSDLVFKFQDKKLVIGRTPRNVALLFGGLSAFDLDNIYLEDMDGKDVYYTLLGQKKLSMNFIKGIDSFFDLFIDPITRDVLRGLREPTDIRDLLIRAVTLLTTSEHLPESSEANFRYRSVECMTGIVYNEMARAFATYKNKSLGSTSKFSMSEYTITQRIQQDALMNNVDTINPIHDIKSYSNITAAGSGGRSAETFMLGDRKFTKDSVGIVSEATVDNGKVGMNAILPLKPTMYDSRGMTTRKDLNDLEPENFLSLNSLVMPGVTQDDAKRQLSALLYSNVHA